MKKQIFIAFIVDLLTISLAWFLYYLFRIKSGWVSYTTEPDLWIPMAVVCVYWVTVFFIAGLYQAWYAKSRFDEFTVVVKSVTVGLLLLFFAVFVDDDVAGTPMHTRLMITIYWGLLIGCVGSGRFLQHTFHKRLLRAGIGLHNTLVVGWTDAARKVADSLRQFPAIGYSVVGFVAMNGERGDHNGVAVVGHWKSLPELIDSHRATDIIIALDSDEHDQLLEVVSKCNERNVSIKIIPDLYDIVSGQARTNQLYGFPLIEIMPTLLTPWEAFVKRTMDVVVSSLVLIIGLPIWCIVAIAIKLESRGPVFYTQERLGKDSRPFKIIKFRSMSADAEKLSGPVWANKDDDRITRVGWFLRKSRIDEIPQLINVLDGDMSLVGPRPEREFFVKQLAAEIPLYMRRLKVRPGVTGWAQIKHKYDENVEDVRLKVQYDLFYIENMSLRMDFKILLNTIVVMLSGQGH